MDEQIALHRALERDIRGLVACLKDLLSAQQAAEVEEFVQAREYGLAVETLAGILLEDGGTIPTFALEGITTLTGLMHGVCTPYLRELQVAHDRQHMARLHR